MIHLNFHGREVAIHADPVHLATHCDLIFTNNWNIVLGLTGYETCITTGAGIEVDRHAPLMNVIGKVGFLSEVVFRKDAAFWIVKTEVWRSVGIHSLLLDLLDLLFEGTFPIKLISGNLTSESASIHGVVLLGEGHFVRIFGQSNLSARGEIRSSDRAKWVSIKSGVETDVADYWMLWIQLDGALAIIITSLTISERNGDGMIGVTEGDKNGNLHRAITDGDGDEWCLGVLPFSNVRFRSTLEGLTESKASLGLESDDLIVDAEFLRSERRNLSGVVPGELGHWVRRFLKPCVINEATVED